MTNLGSERFDQGMGLLNRAGFIERRRALVADLHGPVLEIGAGTGRNSLHYPPAARVVATDLNAEHLYLAQRRGFAFSWACADAQSLPFAANAFEAVVGTLVFCSIPDPRRALTEVMRVLRPGGRLVLLEHVRGQGPLSRRFTDWLQPLWFAMQGECNLNRETARTVGAAGFQLDSVRQDGWFGLLAEIRASKPD